MQPTALIEDLKKLTCGLAYDVEVIDESISGTPTALTIIEKDILICLYRDLEIKEGHLQLRGVCK